MYLKGGWNRELVAYGLDMVSSCVLEGQGSLLVMRDLMDVLLLHSRGFRNAVAVGKGGAGLDTERWERLADLGIRRVTLTPNRGEDSFKDVLTALESAFRAKAAPAVFVVPPERWPGARGPTEFVRLEGPTALRDFLERERVDGSQYVLRYLKVNGRESPDRWQSSEADTAAIPGVQTPQRLALEGDRDSGPQCPTHHCSETVCFCFD
jgi:hypothetical protein